MTETPHASSGQDADTSGAGMDASDSAPTVYSDNPISESDYEAIANAVMETERGRWFLKEYARRNRNADTQTVLDALERLEERIESKGANEGSDTSVALISHNVIDLAEAITQVKREVLELGGKQDQPDHFNSATVELEAIVTQTETATGEILEAAEKIQEVLWVLREEGANETQCDIIESKIIDIYTACSFQDLTGQRSSKVVRLVGYVEKRVGAMMGILGIAPRDDKGDGETETNFDKETSDTQPQGTAYQEGDARADAHLLHGPALEGEGFEQDDVDALFATTDEGGKTELHEADMFSMADEEDLLGTSSQSDDPAPDIFDVDTLEFHGRDMGETAGTEIAEGRDLGLLIAHMPDDFAVDDLAGDMFHDNPSIADERPALAPQTDNHSADAQDIFEVDDFAIDNLAVADEESAEQDAEQTDLETAADDAAPVEALEQDRPANAQDSDDEEDHLDQALSELDGADTGNDDQLARASQDGESDSDDEDELPYTDEERIALFS